MVFEKFSEKQRQITDFIFSDSDTLICDGAVRSGKTIVMIYSFVFWAMANFDRTNFAICGKTVGNAEKNIVKPFQMIQGMPYAITYRLSNRMMTVKCGKKENYFYIYGGKDESSYMLIQGITLAGVLFDEVALMPKSFVDQAIARTLSFGNAKIWFNCNPESPEHWFYKDWLQNDDREKTHLHFLMSDNPILTKKELDRAKKQFTGVFYQRYILGEWVRAEGLIYTVFAEDIDRYMTEAPDYDYIQIGIDFGGNGSAHSFTATGLKNDNSKLTVLMTKRIDAKGSDPEDLYRWFGEFSESIQGKYGYISSVYCDSAEQVLIAGLRSRFPQLSFRNSIKNEIIDRIRGTTSLMAGGRFFITRDCQSLKNAFCSAVYDETQQDDTRLDNGTSDIDSLDSFEYSWENQLKRYTKYRGDVD